MVKMIKKIKKPKVQKMSREDFLKSIKKDGFFYQTDFTLNLTTGKSKEHTIYTHSEIKEKSKLKDSDPNVTKAIRDETYKSITKFKSYKF